MPSSSRVAAIDIGTNTLLLLIAEQRAGGLVAIHEDCRFGRLGQGLDATGELALEAITRSVAIAGDYAKALAAYEVHRVCAVGTQALREASNATAFIAPAEQLLGTSIEVIDGNREAELVYAATVKSFPELAAGELIVADVGGGSTEVIVGRGGQVVSRISIPIGSVRLAERHLRIGTNDLGPPTPEQARAMCAEADDALAALELPAGAPVVATAGTATTLAAVQLRLRQYDPARIQGTRLPIAIVERQLATYLELTVRERLALPGLEPERADVIPAGAAIFARLLRHAGAAELIVSDRGVRWGLAYELV